MHFLFEWVDGITILPSTDASPVTSTTRLCYITDCTCVLCPYSQVATVSNPFPSWSVPFVIYYFPILLCDLSIPYLVYFSKPLYSNYRQFRLPRNNSTTSPGIEDSAFRFSVPIGSHWSPTAPAVPITLYGYRDRIYAHITSFIRCN